MHSCTIHTAFWEIQGTLSKNAKGSGRQESMNAYLSFCFQVQACHTHEVGKTSFAAKVSKYSDISAQLEGKIKGGER